MAARLTTLPQELLTEICWYLCRHCARTQPYHGSVAPQGPVVWARDNRDDLRSLGQTCRTLRAAVEPFLYHHLATAQELDLHRFVQALSQRPDLQRKVRELDINHAGYHSPFSSAPAGLEVEVQQRPSPQAAPTDLRMADPETEIQRDPSSRLQDARQHITLVSRLLQLAPNLHSAHVRLPDCGRSPLRIRLGSSTVVLASLKAVSFRSLQDSFLLDLAIPMLRLAPNLEALHCHDCARVSGCWTPSGRIYPRSASDGFPCSRPRRETMSSSSMMS